MPLEISCQQVPKCWGLQAQSVTRLYDVQTAEHVNPPAKIKKTVVLPTGRRLLATAPAPAPAMGASAARDMPPLPPIQPGMAAQAPQPGAMPAQEVQS